mmetsp:Transcript_2266/g.5598  ORF Transcript_2266/g.5598 Transcript_2266/m.5598 type:complete len:365 (-) Transcript_2266:570-1664(-)
MLHKMVRIDIGHLVLSAFREIDVFLQIATKVLFGILLSIHGIRQAALPCQWVLHVRVSDIAREFLTANKKRHRHGIRIRVVVARSKCLRLLLLLAVICLVRVIPEMRLRLLHDLVRDVLVREVLRLAERLALQVVQLVKVLGRSRVLLKLLLVEQIQRSVVRAHRRALSDVHVRRHVLLLVDHLERLERLVRGSVVAVLLVRARRVLARVAQTVQSSLVFVPPLAVKRRVLKWLRVLRALLQALRHGVLLPVLVRVWERAVIRQILAVLLPVRSVLAVVPRRPVAVVLVEALDVRLGGAANTVLAVALVPVVRLRVVGWKMFVMPFVGVLVELVVEVFVLVLLFIGELRVVTVVVHFLLRRFSC